MTFSFSIEEATKALQAENAQAFTVLLQHGSMSLEYYVPKLVDAQQPHRQDEIYVIASGNAIFNRNSEKTECKQGDVLFVPAGMKHHFERFSEDFATWVIFYGKEGGEAV